MKTVHISPQQQVGLFCFIITCISWKRFIQCPEFDLASGAQSPWINTWLDHSRLGQD